MPLTEPLRSRAVDAEPLAPLTTLGVGGAARWLLRARTIDDVERAHRWNTANGTPLFVLGGGSNLVIADAVSTDWSCTSTFEAGNMRTRADTLVTAGAGESWDETVADCVARGLAGLECLSGIPGTVGGTPIQNVGAYGQEVANCIDHLTAFDRKNGAMRTLTERDCRFPIAAADSSRLTAVDLLFAR